MLAGIVLPEKWCVNRSGQPEICKWFNARMEEQESEPGRRPNFDHELRGPFTHWPITNSGNYSKGSLEEGYTLISVDFFNKHILNAPENQPEDLSYLIEMFKRLNII